MMGIAVLVGLTLSLGWTLIEWGGIPLAPRFISIFSIGFLAAVYSVFSSRKALAPGMGRLSTFSFVAILCYIGCQLIPLPISFLRVIDPAKGALVAALGPVIPSISKAQLSVYPPGTVVMLFSMSSYIAVYVLVRELAWRFMRNDWSILLPILLLGSLEAGYGVFQVWSPGHDGRASGTFTNWDHYSGFLEVVLPVSIVYGVACLRSSHDRAQSLRLFSVAKACFVWTLAAMMLVAISYSLSRSGFVVAIASSVFVAILCINPARFSRVGRWASVGGLLALGLACFVFVSPEGLIERFGGMADARPTLWKETLSLIKEFPMFGVGSGGFESTFLKYQETATSARVNFAHNDYLQYLAEFGFAGYLILACALVAALAPLFLGLKNDREGQGRYIAVACLGSALALALHSLVDFNSYVPATALTMAWILGAGSIYGLSGYSGSGNYSVVGRTR